MELIQLHQDFAAEIRGISLIDVVTDEWAYEAVRAAFESHSVLVFRSQVISDEVQALFSRAFGPLEITRCRRNRYGLCAHHEYRTRWKYR